MRRIVLSLAVLVGVLVAGQAFGATFVEVYPGDDLDAKANAASAGDTIQVHAGTYLVNQPITLEAGQTLTGDVGTVTNVGSANVPHPTVFVKGATGTTQTTMLKATGDPITVEWLDLDATNTQKAINGLAGGPNLLMSHVVVHGAPASGIGQYRGTVSDSEIYGNGTDPTHFDGTVSGIKCNYACEVSHSYVHDNPGNGIWCDVGCQYVSKLDGKGFYVHDNVSGDNGRHGIFFENAPRPCYGSNSPCNGGDVRVRSLITDNLVYGNGKSGVSCSDSWNCEVSFNEFGKRVDGTLDHNAGNDGVEMHSSNDPSRGTQKDAFIHDNIMHTETIDGTGTGNSGCGDNGNVCTNNLDELAPETTTGGC